MKRSTSGRLFVSAVGVCLLGLGGCGGSERVDVFPVTGKVTYKDQPVAGAQIAFHPQGRSPRRPIGTTDAEGNYQLTSFNTNDGAPAGEYIVTIMKSDNPNTGVEAYDSSADSGDLQAYDQAMKAASTTKKSDVQTTLPAKYADPETSPEKRTVTEQGPNKFDFELTD